MLVTEADLAARGLRAGGLVGGRLVRVVELAADPAELAHAGGGVVGGGAEHPVVDANLGSRDDRLGQFRLHPYVFNNMSAEAAGNPATRVGRALRRSSASCATLLYSEAPCRGDAAARAASGRPGPYLWPQDARDTRYVVP